MGIINLNRQTMKELEITIDGVTLEVKYEFDEGSDGNYSFAPVGDQIEILHTSVDGLKTDITDLLSKYVINEIESKIYHYEKLA